MVCKKCGKPSGFYPLCINCNKLNEDKLKEDGVGTKCESCGIWKKNSKPLCHECWKSKGIKKGAKSPSINYKPQIINKSPPNWREKYPREVLTKHGFQVRSGIERTIAEFLTDNHIIFEYERLLILENQQLHPDFYLQDYNIYLEHWGSDEPGYIEYRRKKEELYKKNNVKYISTDKSDVNNIYDKLKIELNRHGLKIV